MRSVWSVQARRDLSELIAHIAAESPRNADLVKVRISKSVQLIETMPNSGRTGRVAGTRERVAGRTPYILVYRIEVDHVRIVSVLRGARKWPKSFSA